ncbi:hypothetical protein [Modicisalibacter luteus]|uniref:hypothetical protein n=1 Tax=Modicisalibacter luteus TaxID=453962 RepID=UPI003627A916
MASSFFLLIALLWFSSTSLPARAEAQGGAQHSSEVLRAGVLKFGTVNWELQVVQEHGLAEKAWQPGRDAAASENALAVALQGAVSI